MKSWKTIMMAATLAMGSAGALAQTPAASPAPAAASAPAAATPVTPQFEHPTPGIGQPDGRFGLQDQVTDIGREALWMHDVVLMPIITAISLFVLGLLLYVVVRFRRSANPVPSRISHNTLIEVIWTVVPVLILVAIAVPSIQLLANQYSPPKAGLTVKVIGHQWYWSYQYPDNGDFEVVSNILKDEDAVRKGEPPHLAVDERMVVPVNTVVKVIVTSDDVLHSFAVPAFWTKMDAVPGRLNETWFKVDRPGVYYGQCSELCGARHGYMPIAVEVVSKAQFAQWIAAKGGTIGGQPATSDATVNSPIENPGGPTVAPATLTPAVAGIAPATPVAEGATSN